ncbi:phage head spike fiber domain-containing protein [Aeromonas caviae]|uniref:phage head spike fiber domain-containing protein n=1 Tax=Aeromonas caviae TaxID=648 RepID=UPI002B45FB25|nr:hypothetical protein [Aeromonas caviae]
MAGIWYRAGTISVTNGSKKITGFGTLWKTTALKPDKGHPVHGPDGRIYELDYVESDTVMYIVTAYAGATAAGQAYAIDIPRTSGIPAFSRDLAAFMGYHQTQMDGWQQLLTGTGDATLTAPDGTKLTLPTWDKVMNAGSGVVAQAKTEADRAKTEAANSAASAASAGNAVVAAALPLPDVWAPLSDSLRLITGYGREVKVGDDVVARMVNFSRSTTATYIGKDGLLKTAVANEPRFEKGGLLIEGQSTNIWPTQIGGGDILNTVIEATQLPDGVIGNSYKITPTPGSFAYIRRSYTAQTGAHSMSCYAKSGDSTGRMPDLYSGFNGRFDTKMVGVAIANGWWRMSAKLESPTGNTGIGFGLLATETTPVYVWGMQLEALPFASSYIPTNGVAATRAGDLCDLTNIGNSSTIMAMAIEYDQSVYNTQGGALLSSYAVGDEFRFRLALARDASLDTDFGLLGFSYDEGRLASIKQYANKSSGGVVFAVFDADIFKVGVKTATNNSLYSVGRTPSSKAPTISKLAIGYYPASNSQIFGHVRNLRIWHRALTDYQLKAIA